jgi:hypothetical protein
MRNNAKNWFDRSGNGFKLILPYTTYRADPVVGQILKSSAGGNAGLIITKVRIIHIPAGDTLILIHFLLLEGNPVDSVIYGSYYTRRRG